MERVYWDEMIVEERPIIIAWTEQGLCYVGSFIETFEHFSVWQEKHFPQAEVVRYNVSPKYKKIAHLHGTHDEWPAS